MSTKSEREHPYTFEQQWFSKLLKLRPVVHEKFRVWIKFPNTREFKHGNYQTLLICGSTNIKQVRDFLNVEIEAMKKDKYNQPKTRTASTSSPQKIAAVNTHSQRSNMFSGLLCE